MTAKPPPFRDPNLPLTERVADLLGRLTVDERLAMLHQFAPPVERLGLAAFRTGQEALHGVAWMGPATVFPQAVGLGATWNTALVRRIGDAVGAEVRAMRERDPRVGLNVWAPVVNLLRHPLWGRNEEGWSEDPHATAALAAAYTRGLRGSDSVHWRTAPVLKHWLAHNNETDRATCSSSVRPRVLYEYDLPAFRGAVDGGAVAGVMPAYNLVNGRPNHLSPYLESELRTWTEDSLVVCSDAGAPTNLVDAEHYYDTHEEALAASLRAGVDNFTDHGEDSSVIVGRLRTAYDKGLLDEADVDRAVRRLLTMRFLLGEFGPDPYADAGHAFDTPAHQRLAAEAAEQAVVLLKNDGILPLNPSAKLAVVGPLADECKLDWYSGTLIRRSTPLTALRERFAEVVHVEGSDTVRLVRASDGLAVHVPQAAGEAADLVRGAEGALDPALLTGRTDLPPLVLDAQGTEVALLDWGGDVLTFKAPDGRYLSVAEDGFVRASADQPGGWVVQETFRLEPLNDEQDGQLLRHIGTGGYVSVATGGLKVAADRAEAEIFRIEYVERGTEAVLRAAAEADVVVVVAGNDPHINGRETEDRSTLALPRQQGALWRAAHSANPRTVLALVSSYPYAVPQADAELPALLWTAHGGQAGGTGLARVLAGEISPAGRLPQTWYAADSDLPGLFDYDVIGSRQTYLYFEGTPLYPFGHGLSYSSFTYEDLTVLQTQDAVVLAVTVANTAGRDADEVVQIYGKAVHPRVLRPRRALLGFERRRIAAGARETFHFRVPRAELGYWDVAHGTWRVDPGLYEFEAGASSGDIRLRCLVEAEGEPAGPRPVRRGLCAVDYDAQYGTCIVDRTKTAGDSVAAEGGGRGELVFGDCDFGDGVRGAVLTVSATGPGEVTLAAGACEVTVPVSATGGPYAYISLDTSFEAEGVRELKVGLAGPVRLAELAFTPASSTPSPLADE
ncbi:glycoside hydrolase family 3 C-terminal domain-containing protein [Streptomyces sp. TRM66268-LWL]|uniref:Glycoside hydrolase family 3 C-terminal domain-containing protein n=1 Tax=Streptomyces polyasparticus TaxID=2767826 RepID=A0ABR7SQR0_9ACTN|nr:glycoside hydrolase family 3 C-terminal domain-containing protein [Streptomyces polyasparticus]MBC9716922.1 glycoside hydrolase family 3 C-terminal domain-containing protein [Streptomyces polyasparticus]